MPNPARAYRDQAEFAGAILPGGQRLAGHGVVADVADLGTGAVGIADDSHLMRITLDP